MESASPTLNPTDPMDAVLTVLLKKETCGGATPGLSDVTSGSDCIPFSHDEEDEEAESSDAEEVLTHPDLFL